MKRAITALRVEQRSSSISSLLWTRPVAVQLRPLVTVLTRGRVLRRCSCSSQRFFSSDVSPHEVEDAFRVLGLASHASPKEVKAVFFRLARELHPDANMGRREGEARLAVISTAFKLAFDAAKYEASHPPIPRVPFHACTHPTLFLAFFLVAHVSNRTSCTPHTRPYRQWQRALDSSRAAGAARAPASGHGLEAQGRGLRLGRGRGLCRQTSSLPL